MNKNSIIGFVLIGLIFIGFTWYNTKQYKKQVEYQAQLDSIANVERLANAHLMDSLAAIQEIMPQEVVPVQTYSVYKDSLLEVASAAEEEFVVLENNKLKISFSTKGAQPYYAQIKDYRNFDSTSLYLFNGGDSQYGISLFTGEYINTKDFVFKVVEKTDSSVLMKLPFTGGGYILQEYSLNADSYLVDNRISFVGMESIIPKNVSAVDMDWTVRVPRMEKGYKNEVQYSKVNCYYPGEKKPEEIGRGRNNSKRLDNRFSWFSFQQQFFSAIMRSKQDFASGSLSVSFFPEDDSDRYLMACEAKTRSDFKHSNNVVYENEFYFGPNHFSTLKSYDQKYEKTIPLGGWLVGWITRFVIIPLFNFLHQFISNFGIIILLMTLFIKIVVLPFAYKSYSSSAKMQVLKPEIDKINEKYPKQEDAMKKQQATMDLYKRAGVNPMGGCLPLFLQFPILWAMFRFFPASIELRQQSFLWAEDLSAYDTFINFGTRIPLIGDHISLFALLVAISTFFYSKANSAGQMSSNDPNAASMRFMSLYMMPIMMFFICNSLSAGLSYYYFLSNTITMGETWAIKKWFVHPDDILAKLKASAGKPVPKSKWQQRLEEAQKMQQKNLKEQQKRR